MCDGGRVGKANPALFKYFMFYRICWMIMRDNFNYVGSSPTHTHSSHIMPEVTGYDYSTGLIVLVEASSPLCQQD